MIASLSQKQRWNIGLLAGLLVGILTTVLMLLLNFLAGGISLPELVGSALLFAIPLSVFDYLHAILGESAKHVLFYGTIVGQCLAFALFGGLFALLTGTKPFQKTPFIHQDSGYLHWFAGLTFGGILWLFVGLILLPLLGAGLFGTTLAIGPVNTMLSLALAGLIFGLLFTLAYNWLAIRLQNQEGSNEEQQTLRRRLLTTGLTLLGLSSIGAIAWRFLNNTPASTPATHLLQNYQPRITPPPTPNYGTLTQVAGHSKEITPNADFYVVSKNIVDPTVDGKSWNLRIEGLVSQPYSLTYDQLSNLAQQQQYESLMCISNPVGGPYMGNANWEGVSLKTLLERAGSIGRGASKVVFYAADDYSDSIHLSKALEPTTMLALRMNGETLSHKHGYPARLLVPGIYGMKHVKWITRIEIVNTDFKGYWQQRQWSDPAPIRMTARIDTPQNNAMIDTNKKTFVAGVAFSGNKGISQVDVSFDNGQHWQRATLKQPLSELTWVLWEIEWQAKAGNHIILARAIDKEGNVQDPNYAPPLPDGASGYHTIQVTAR